MRVWKEAHIRCDEEAERTCPQKRGREQQQRGREQQQRGWEQQKGGRGLQKGNREQPQRGWEQRGWEQHDREQQKDGRKGPAFAFHARADKEKEKSPHYAF